MFCFECADKVEVTTDKNIVNELLRDGWAIIDVIATHKKEYLFLLGYFSEVRIETAFHDKIQPREQAQCK